MLSAFLLMAFLAPVTWSLAIRLVDQHPGTRPAMFRNLILVHFLLALVYYLYALSNSSDSQYYYFKVLSHYRGYTWWDFYGVSTTFVEFLAYPFVHIFQFSYEACMILFAWMGLLGFFFFYVFLHEQIRHRHTFFGFDLVTLILLLPNLHFWSSSMGKGSVVFLGFGLLFYSFSRLEKRWLSAILGAMLIYHIRPHILFIVLIAAGLGFIFSSRGISTPVRIMAVMASLVAFFIIREEVFALTGIDEEQLVVDSTTLSHRAKELSKATSGIDINGYSWPLKIFTFWFRPLFIDAPGLMGLMVSFENVFYLVLFFNLFKPRFWLWFAGSDYMVKAAALTFLGVSFALAQLSGNLGIAIRQKSQVMILMLFVIVKYLDEAMAADAPRTLNGPATGEPSEGMVADAEPSAEPASRMNPSPGYVRYLNSKNP